MTTVTIDLEKYKTKGSKVFTGRERGQSIRADSKIDELVGSYDLVEILIPTDVMSINPSFLEEFLFNVVKKLGKEKFNEKIKFLSENMRYNIAEDLEEAVDRILRSNRKRSN